MAGRPSAHRPLEGFGGRPSEQSGCSPVVTAGGGAVTLGAGGGRPSAHRPLEGSGEDHQNRVVAHL